jgi:hypothetical protein
MNEDSEHCIKERIQDYIFKLNEKLEALSNSWIELRLKRKKQLT